MIVSSNRRVVIGDYAFLAHEVVLADSSAAKPFRDSAEPEPPSRVGESVNEIEIGPCSWIGARAVLMSGARIGEGAIIGAAALVDFEVPPNAIVAGNPARIVGWVR